MRRWLDRAPNWVIGWGFIALAVLLAPVGMAVGMWWFKFVFLLFGLTVY